MKNVVKICVYEKKIVTLRRFLQINVLNKKNMTKTKVLTLLLILLVLSPAIVNAAPGARDWDRLEFGPAVGVGFYVGNYHPIASTNEGLLRIPLYDVVALNTHEKAHLSWPGIETFGFSVGYRFNTRWHLLAKTTRQRVAFVEYDEGVRGLYYNAMWHVDVMAEYNLLNYGNKMQPTSGLYNVVPYIGLGLGCTMYNQNATLRAVNGGDMNEQNINTWQPQIGKLYKGKNDVGEVIKGSNPLGVGLYVPVAFGVKWRINDNVQLKGAFQYQLYFSNNKAGGLNSNIEGATAAEYYTKAGQAAAINIQNRPTFEQLDKHIVGFNHDCLFSISAIFNLEKWREDRLVDF